MNKLYGRVPVFLLILFLRIVTRTKCKVGFETESSVFEDDISMPGVIPTQHDEYLCTAKKVEYTESFIVQYEAHSENNKAHHILLFGCSDVDEDNLKKGYWKCGDGNICENMKIMYAWAKNAEPTKLPKDVGFRIGGQSDVNYLVLEIHYAHPLNESDRSGITLYTTYEQQKYIAGIFLLLSFHAKIPPFKPKVHADINCAYEHKFKIHPFAYRVHAHALGVVVSGYKFSTKTQQWTMLGKGNPQWPQAFYPMKEVYTVEDGDYMAARCTFNSSGRDRWTYIGSTADDEMCNFYMMYYTDSKIGLPFGECADVADDELVTQLPLDSDVPLPRNPLLEEHAHNGMGQSQHQHMMMDKKGESHRPKTPPQYDYYSTEYSYEDKIPQMTNTIPHRGKVNHNQNQDDQTTPETTTTTTNAQKQNEDQTALKNLYQQVSNWPDLDVTLGQVSAIAMNKKGDVLIFHRADRVWGMRSFDMFNNFAEASEGAIPNDTILVIDALTGKILKRWGANMFYLPHGLSLDKDDNVWITDVALHQVMKFPAGGSKEASLTLGVRLEAGSDDNHFCKPTSVAVTSTGDFFVADGYCNSRIMKYSADGKLLIQFGKKTISILGFKFVEPPPYAFSVPHKLSLIEEKGLVCVADRENGRIQCFSIANGTFYSQLKPNEFGDRVFAIAYAAGKGGLMFAVNGPQSYKTSANVQGFVLNFTSQTLIGTINPSSDQLHNPHDVIASPDGEQVYICEIGPNKIWKFTSQKTAVTPSVVVPQTNDANYQSKDALFEENKAVKTKSLIPSVSEWSSSDGLAPTLVIIALLAIPVLLMILVTVFIRLKKQGKFHSLNVGHVKGWMSGYKQPNSDRFTLGKFLHPHKGFDRVSMEESDVGSSDSDVEEFTAPVQKA